MLKKIFAFSISIVFFAAFALVGCSHTATGPDGSTATVDANGNVTATDAKGNTVSVSGNGQHMTVQSKNGSTAMNMDNLHMNATDSKGNSVNVGDAVTEDELGVPFYPGSMAGPGDVKSSSTSDSTVESVRSTTDDPAKVIAFYTGKLGKPTQTVSSDAMSMASWSADKKTESLMVSKVKDTYQIVLTVVTKK